MEGGGAAPPDAAPAPNVAAGPAGIRVENCYVFKSRLQEYAQKAGFATPEYHTLKEGPSHEPVFKSTVLLNNTRYESLPGFFSRKAAEQSAAEVALMDIVKSVPPTEAKSIPAVQETGLCKNLLQEYAQKMNYAIPSYICTKQASGVSPFICTVEIGGIQYIGAAARTKKEAEIKAARTALLVIQGRSEGCTNGATKYIVVPGQRQVKETEKRPIKTPKPLKAKKNGFKKKRNKRKFIRKAGAGLRDILDCDAPVQATITEELSSDTFILQPDEDARRLKQDLLRDTAMLQTDQEDKIAKLEPLSDTAMLLQDEATTVGQEPSRDTGVVQPYEEVISVKQRSPSHTSMLQHDDEARIVDQEPPTETARILLSNSEILKPHEEARSIGQDTVSDSVALQPDGEATNCKSTSTIQHKEEVKITEQETPHSTGLVQPS